MTTPNPNTHYLMPIGSDTAEMELAVMNWFAAGHEVLWIPIYEIANEPDGIADANAEMAHFGGPRVLRNIADCLWLPLGIKGWLFPAHLDDTDVICTRTDAQEVAFGPLIHPMTGQHLSYRYATEAPIHRSLLYCGDKSGL